MGKFNNYATNQSDRYSLIRNNNMKQALILFLFFTFNSYADEPNVKRDCKSGYLGFSKGSSKVHLCPNDSNGYKADFVSTGSNYHSCWLATTLEKIGSKYVSQQDSCKVEVSFSENKLKVANLKKCRNFCGMRAGFADGDYSAIKKSMKKNKPPFQVITSHSKICPPIAEYFSDISQNSKSINIRRLTESIKKIDLGGYNLEIDYDLDRREAIFFNSVELQYEDINNDGIKELFSSWMTYANSSIDNRSLIYVYNYPISNYLEDIFTKGKYKSKYYNKLESFMISSYKWESNKGSVDAQSLLPAELELEHKVIWKPGVGFSRRNDYRLNVFRYGLKNYILVEGRWEQAGKYFILEMINTDNQKFNTICELQRELT